MSLTLLYVQSLNGLQLGVLLFLIAAGLTLVFGVMDFINLAHGVQYMIGAYLAAMFTAMTGSFFLGLLLALPSALLFGLALEFLIFRHLYDRDHLDQVLATFGIILTLNQAVKVVWGSSGTARPAPSPLTTQMLPPDMAAPISGTSELMSTKVLPSFEATADSVWRRLLTSTRVEPRPRLRRLNWAVPELCG